MSDANNFQIWLLAARPKTLPAGAVPVLVGGALAWETGVFHLPALLLALAGSLLIQIGTNFVNDLCDCLKNVDDAERIGPLRVTQAGLVTPGRMKRACFFVFGLALLCGGYLVYRGGVPILIVGVASILCGVLYTAGPRPIGYLGLGEIFVLIFYGPVAVCGTYYVITLDVPPVVLLASLSPGLLATAILAVNNLRDLDNDRRTGKRTLAVRFGRTFARGEYIALVVGALLLPLLLLRWGDGHPWLALTLFAMIPAIPLVRRVVTSTEGPVLNDALAATGRLLVLFGLLFCAGWLL
ncbi:MAG: 1,4-dihydroxy-2-naphthoate polyprenyltransferase [bacterium]